MTRKTTATAFDSASADAQDNSFLGYPPSQGLISTADPEFEEPTVPTKAKATPKSTRSSKKEPSEPVSRRQLETLLVGLDLGTNTTCVQIAELGADTAEATETIPTVVGYARPGILPNVLPGNQTTFFGQDALDNKLHLDLKRPLQDGVVTDLDAVRDFLSFVKDRIGNLPNTEYRAVIGMPANATAQARENARLAATGIFDKVILIPEPFLAALGSRSESTGFDPIANSLFIDIGAGSSDLCLIQGYFPLSEDQLSFNFAGDALDALIQNALVAKYPDCGVSLDKCREIKEQHSFVRGATESAMAPVMIRGKVKRLEVADAVETACNALLSKIFETVKTLIVQADPDSIPGLLENIIITGGGSMIPGFGDGLESLLEEEGFEGCKVHCIGSSYKTRVAAGALEAARQADDRQWQNLLR